MPIQVTCYHCDGTGVSPVDQETCRICGGTGITDAIATVAKIRARTESNYDFLVDLALSTNVFHSHIVLEALDATEHDALTDTQKEGVRILLSCGRVDLREGKAGRVRLWSWFGAESTTVANLTALLS